MKLCNFTDDSIEKGLQEGWSVCYVVGDNGGVRNTGEVDAGEEVKDGLFGNGSLMFCALRVDSSGFRGCRLVHPKLVRMQSRSSGDELGFR